MIILWCFKPILSESSLSHNVNDYYEYYDNKSARVQLVGYKAISTSIDSRDALNYAFIRDVEYYKTTSIRPA